MQFGKHTPVSFQTLQIAFVLRTRAIFIVFEKLTRACFSQIAYTKGYQDTSKESSVLYTVLVNIYTVYIHINYVMNTGATITCIYTVRVYNPLSHSMLWKKHRRSKWKGENTVKIQGKNAHLGISPHLLCDKKLN